MRRYLSIEKDIILDNESYQHGNYLKDPLSPPDGVDPPAPLPSLRNDNKILSRSLLPVNPLPTNANDTPHPLYLVPLIFSHPKMVYSLQRL